MKNKRISKKTSHKYKQNENNLVKTEVRVKITEGGKGD